MQDKLKKIIIYAPDVYFGDAIGNHCFGLYRLAMRLGFSPILFASRFSSDEIQINGVNELYDLNVSGSILLISYSIYDEHLEKLISLPCKKICYFHGITPPELLTTYEPKTALHCAKGLQQLSLLNVFDRIVTNSKQSAKLLLDSGIEQSIVTMPPVFADMSLLKQPFGDNEQDSINPSYTLLFVGRVVPHKNIEAAIELLVALKVSLIDCHLVIVGAQPNHTYFTFLLNHARKLGVLDAVTFTGKVSVPELYDHFIKASLLISTSKHEGFCLPALEAMYFGKPVFAFAGTALEEFLISPCAVQHKLVDLIKCVQTYLTKSNFIHLNHQLHQHSLAIISQTEDASWNKILDI